MPLGMEVGLSLGEFVLDGDQITPPEKGTEPPIFDPCLLQRNGCIDPDATWYGGRPQPRGLVLDGDQPPPQRLFGEELGPHVTQCGPG